MYCCFPFPAFLCFFFLLQQSVCREQVCFKYIIKLLFLIAIQHCHLQYLRGLQKLGEIMKMDRISLDMGLDMTMDSLTARAEQLVKLEADALADRSTHVYNLQRKVYYEYALESAVFR